jgi:uncharacterized protein (TIGR04255 family)
MEQTRQLANAPLVLAIAAVRFESLEALPSWIPSIQERVRKALPSFRRMQQIMTPRGLEIALDPSDFDPEKSSSSWLFSATDFKTVITIHKGGIVLHTIEYKIFQDFSAVLRVALDALMTSAEVLNVNQIGMRYVDHIQPQHGMDTKEFIVNSLMPNKSQGNLTVQNASSSATYISTESTPNATLNVRFSIGDGEPIIPHDLAVAHAVASVGNAAEEVFYHPRQLEDGAGVLDMDAGLDDLGGKSMSTAHILEVVDRLHRVANDYFDSVITSEARRAWSTPK